MTRRSVARGLVPGWLPRRVPRLAAAFAVAFLLGAATGTALAPSRPPVELEGVWKELDAVSAELQEERARADRAARSAEVAGVESGWMGVRVPYAATFEAWDQGDRVSALWWANDLRAAATHTPWPPLLERAAARVASAAEEVAQALFLEDGQAVEDGRGELGAAVAALDLEVREKYLAYYGEQPLGPRVVLVAHITGFRVLGDAATAANPTLSMHVGETMLLELRNSDEMAHNIVIEGVDVRSDLIGANETVGLLLSARAPGSFEYFCDVPGHKETMTGNLLVEP